MDDILTMEDLKKHIMSIDKDNLIIIINDIKELSDDNFILSIGDIMKIRNNTNTLVVYPKGIETDMLESDKTDSNLPSIFSIHSMKKVKGVCYPSSLSYMANLILLYTDKGILVLKSRIFPRNTFIDNIRKA